MGGSKDGAKINGLPAKVLDVDWAASDRAVLAGADGTLRVVGLALTPATSAMSEYGLLDCSSRGPIQQKQFWLEFRLENPLEFWLEIFLH